MSTPTHVRQRRGVSTSSRAGLLQNQEGEEEEDVMDTGTLDTISQQYESLNYDTNYNSLLLDEIRKMGFKFVKRTVDFLSCLSSNNQYYFVRIFSAGSLCY